MNVSIDNNSITIALSEINAFNCRLFIEEYKILYENITGAGKRVLIIKECDNFAIRDNKVMLVFANTLFSKFKKQHTEHISNIEIRLNNKSLISLCKKIFVLCPPKHEYKFILGKDVLTTEIMKE